MKLNALIIEVINYYGLSDELLTMRHYDCLLYFDSTKAGFKFDEKKNQTSPYQELEFLYKNYEYFVPFCELNFATQEYGLGTYDLPNNIFDRINNIIIKIRKEKSKIT